MNQKNQNCAIVIGVNQYKFIQPLQYAVKDAESMANFLQNEAEFDKVYLFTDNPGTSQSEPANRQNLRRLLNRKFENPFLKPGDNLWFFFSGHGIQHQGQDYLMLADGDPDDIPESAIALNYVTSRLKRCGADNIVLIIDACRNQGQKSGIGIGTEGQKGVISFFSCAPEQRSYEIPELEQGVFTTAILEGLGNQGKCATVARLDEYVRHRVPQLLQQHQRQGTQSPHTIVEPLNKYHLILLPKYAEPADIAPLKTEAFRAEVNRDYQRAKQLWIRVSIASKGTDLEVVEAIQRIALAQIGGDSPLPPAPVPDQLDILLTPPSVVPESLIVVETPPKPLSFLETLATFPFETVTVNRKGEIIKREKKQAKYFTEDLGNGISLEMVYIPGGEFQMGSPNTEKRWDSYDGREEPQHRVKVPAYFMSKYPITQEQWEIIAKEPKKQRKLDPNPSRFKGKKRPIERVNWYDTIEWCARLSAKTQKQYRLPSEAQWEYGCRGGTQTPFHYGETLTSQLANYDGTKTYAEEPKGEYREETTEVGKFPPNAYGLYDSHGNVWEWCLDPWHDNYEGAPTDGSVWDENKNHYQSLINNDYLVNILNDERRRLLRGGSWINNPDDCRAAYRTRISPDDRDLINDNNGFRVVCAVAVAWT